VPPLLGRVTIYDLVILSTRWQDDSIDMKVGSIDMKVGSMKVGSIDMKVGSIDMKVGSIDKDDYHKMTVSIWKVTVSMGLVTPLLGKQRIWRILSHGEHQAHTNIIKLTRRTGHTHEEQCANLTSPIYVMALWLRQ